MSKKDPDHAPGGSKLADAGRGDGHDIAGRLGELARALDREQDVEETLAVIVHAAAGTVPGAEHASISAIICRSIGVRRSS